MAEPPDQDSSCRVCGASASADCGHAAHERAHRAEHRDEHRAEPPPLRELRPVTSDDVPGVLREALDMAVDSKLRGVVVLLAYHGTTRIEYLSGGEINLAEAALLIDRLKFNHFCDQRGGVR